MIYTITPGDLIISNGDDPNCWRIADDQAGSEIATLVRVVRFDIRARLSAASLRDKTCYLVYLVYRFDCQAHGLAQATASVRFQEDMAPGTDDEGYTVYLGRTRGRNEHGRFPTNRNDGWMELELGEFINNHGPCSEVDIRLFETSGREKSGIVIKGIELRRVRVS